MPADTAAEGLTMFTRPGDQFVDVGFLDDELSGAIGADDGDAAVMAAFAPLDDVAEEAGVSLAEMIENVLQMWTDRRRHASAPS